MKTLLVGGSIDTMKKSSIIKELGEFFNDIQIQNGLTPDTLKGFDLTIWMPNYPNTWNKEYPIKDKASVLICSKVMRQGHTHVDSCARIFEMQGNAVIEIYKEEDIFSFELRDALNYCWCNKTPYLAVLYEGIKSLYKWTKSQSRRSLIQQPELTITNIKTDTDLYYKFIQINKQLADKVAENCGNRFFGNYSNRCTKLFPSYRNSDNLFCFSPRNIDKRYVTIIDKVICDYNYYYGNRKPSIDTPVQLEVYKNFPGINYIIHGHAYIEKAVYTDNYFPCGDMREVEELIKLYKKGHELINCKHHGFVILCETIEDVEKYYNDSNFITVWNK